MLLSFVVSCIAGMMRGGMGGRGGPPPGMRGPPPGMMRGQGMVGCTRYKYNRTIHNITVDH